MSTSSRRRKLPFNVVELLFIKEIVNIFPCLLPPVVEVKATHIMVILQVLNFCFSELDSLHDLKFRVVRSLKLLVSSEYAFSQKIISLSKKDPEGFKQGSDKVFNLFNLNRDNLLYGSDFSLIRDRLNWDIDHVNNCFSVSNVGQIVTIDTTFKDGVYVSLMIDISSRFILDVLVTVIPVSGKHIKYWLKKVSMLFNRQILVKGSVIHTDSSYSDRDDYLSFSVHSGYVPSIACGSLQNQVSESHNRLFWNTLNGVCLSRLGKNFSDLSLQEKVYVVEYSVLLINFSCSSVPILVQRSRAEIFLSKLLTPLPFNIKVNSNSVISCLLNLWSKYTVSELLLYFQELRYREVFGSNLNFRSQIDFSVMPQEHVLNRGFLLQLISSNSFKLDLLEGVFLILSSSSSSTFEKQKQIANGFLDIHKTDIILTEQERVSLALSLNKIHVNFFGCDIREVASIDPEIQFIINTILSNKQDLKTLLGDMKDVKRGLADISFRLDKLYVDQPGPSKTIFRSDLGVFESSEKVKSTFNLVRSLKFIDSSQGVTLGELIKGVKKPKKRNLYKEEYCILPQDFDLIMSTIPFQNRYLNSRLRVGTVLLRLWGLQPHQLQFISMDKLESLIVGSFLYISPFDKQLHFPEKYPIVSQMVPLLSLIESDLVVLRAYEDSNRLRIEEDLFKKREDSLKKGVFIPEEKSLLLPEDSLFWSPKVLTRESLNRSLNSPLKKSKDLTGKILTSQSYKRGLIFVLSRLVSLDLLSKFIHSYNFTTSEGYVLSGLTDEESVSLFSIYHSVRHSDDIFNLSTFKSFHLDSEVLSLIQGQDLQRYHKENKKKV